VNYKRGEDRLKRYDGRVSVFLITTWKTRRERSFFDEITKLTKPQMSLIIVLLVPSGLGLWSHFRIGTRLPFHTTAGALYAIFPFFFSAAFDSQN